MVQKTVAALVALTPELAPPWRHAALECLAPHANQSGQTEAYRRTLGGRTEIRRVLFMAAISAAKHNPTFSAFYKDLLSAGENPSPQSCQNSSSSQTPGDNKPKYASGAKSAATKESRNDP